MEIRDALQAGTTTAIVSTGGIEQNGPHLALGKHNYMLELACEGIARALGDALCAPVIKLVPEGDIDPPSGHMRYPGTLSLREETFEAVLTDVANSLATHWSMMHKGKIMIRTDSGMNLSPEIYDEFIRPYDQRLLNEFGGGAVHFCGRGSHYIASTCSMGRMYAIAMSQPHLNEMETIYRNTIDKGIKLLGFDKQHAKDALAAGREMNGCVHCW